MMITMRPSATAEEEKVVREAIEKAGYKPRVIHGAERTVIGVVGGRNGLERLQSLKSLPGVEEIQRISKPYKLVGRELHPEDTVIDLGKGISIGNNCPLVVMAGPCAPETSEQIGIIATEVAKAGAVVLRGGAYKPRSDPYTFQGLEEEGLMLLKKASEETGMLVITEVMDPRDVELIQSYSDVLQIGTRNMQNFSLLKEVGKSGKPVLLKRGMWATITEWLMSAEYILKEGNEKILLCERGIRAFDMESTRNTLDLAAIPVVKRESHLPVIVDPSHATGRWDLIEKMSLAAVVVGADGLLIEVHHDPANAWCDGPQSLKPKRFHQLMEKLPPYAELAGRTIAAFG